MHLQCYNMLSEVYAKTPIQFSKSQSQLYVSKSPLWWLDEPSNVMWAFGQSCFCRQLTFLLFQTQKKRCVWKKKDGVRQIKKKCLKCQRWSWSKSNVWILFSTTSLFLPNFVCIQVSWCKRTVPCTCGGILRRPECTPRLKKSHIVVAQLCCCPRGASPWNVLRGNSCCGLCHQRTMMLSGQHTSFNTRGIFSRWMTTLFASTLQMVLAKFGLIRVCLDAQQMLLCSTRSPVKRLVPKMRTTIHLLRTVHLGAMVAQ